MMTLDHRQHHMDSLRNILSVFIYPIQYLVTLPGAVGEWLGESVTTRRILTEQNTILRTQQLVLNMRLQRLSALEAENERLRRLLDSSVKVKQRVLIAEILSVDMAPFSRQIVLNKGSRQQVHRGQPILDATGVMGQVISVLPFSSTAILITDPSHAIPVEVNRNGLRSIALGIGEPNRIDLSPLPSTADIESGDLLVTSGLGGRFPSGYPVATVTRVTHTPGQPFTEVSAEPAARLESTRQVLLVWSDRDNSEGVSPPVEIPATAPGERD
jgi:rod shape-determining protein MreC